MNEQEESFFPPLRYIFEYLKAAYLFVGFFICVFGTAVGSVVSLSLLGVKALLLVIPLAPIGLVIAFLFMRALNRQLDRIEGL
jgi:uncharacterized membrane protein